MQHSLHKCALPSLDLHTGTWKGNSSAQRHAGFPPCLLPPLPTCCPTRPMQLGLPRQCPCQAGHQGPHLSMSAPCLTLPLPPCSRTGFRIQISAFQSRFQLCPVAAGSGRCPTATCTGNEHPTTLQCPPAGTSLAERCPSGGRDTVLSVRSPKSVSPSMPLLLLIQGLLEKHGGEWRPAGHLCSPPLLALQEPAQERMLPLSPSLRQSQLQGAETLLRYARSPSQEC